MGVFNQRQVMTRLGAQTMQPLGLWPATRDGGSFGMNGVSVQPAVVPVNMSGYYTLRPATQSPGSTVGADRPFDADLNRRPTRQPNAN